MDDAHTTHSRRDFTPDFVKAVEAVRADPRWGPVYRGDLSDYDGDHSRADLALCGEFARLGLMAGGIDTAFRTSGLYRDKWERDDYRNNTIAKALTNAEPKANDQEAQVCLIRRTAGSRSAPRRQHRGTTRLRASLCPPNPRSLPASAAFPRPSSPFSSQSRSPLGNPFMGKAAKPGNVIVILGEEDRAEIDRRLSAVARYDKLDGAQIQALQTNILGYPLVGCDVRLTANGKNGADRDDVRQGDHRVARAPSAMCVLIVLDHYGALHGGDFNAREDAALTMRVVNHVAQETGASVLVLAHTPKSANQKEAVRRIDGRGLYGVRGPSARGLGHGDHATDRGQELRYLSG